MENPNATIEILNDLILINNDRIEGYEKAIRELLPVDADLHIIFQNMINESQKDSFTLGKEVQILGGTIAEGTMSAKIYRKWLEQRNAYIGHDRYSVLSACEAGEDAAQKAYRAALREERLPAFLKNIIMDQQQMLKQSHDEIKSFRTGAVELQ